MQFNYLDEFTRELKKLSKKLPSLEGDLENFKKFVAGVDFDNNKRFVTIHRDANRQIRIIKTRLMVRCLKNTNKTRLVFSFCVRGKRIDLIEIYMKTGGKMREDSLRVREYLKN